MGAHRGSGRHTGEVVKGLPRYVALLEDGDAAVRASAAHLLGWLGTEAKKTKKAIGARVASETDPAALASAVLALGYLGPLVGDDGDVPAMRARLSHGTPRVADAAAVALLHRGAADEEVIARLDAIVSRAPRKLFWWDLVAHEVNRAVFGWPLPSANDDGFAWGALDAIVAAHLPKLHTTHPREALALLAGVREGGSLAGDEAGRRALEALAAPDVDPTLKRRLLTLYATREDIWTKGPGKQLAAVGLPDRPWALRAELGLPPRELDREYALRGAPATARAALETAIAEGAVPALLDELDRQPTEDAWSIGLAWTNVYPLPQGFSEQLGERLSVRAGIEAIVERDAMAWLRAGKLPAVVTDDGWQSKRVGMAMLAVHVGALLAARGTPPGKWLEAVGMLLDTDSYQTARKALAAVPLERRVPVVATTIRGNFSGDMLSFLRLAPTREIAEKVIALSATRPASGTNLVELLAVAGTLAPEAFASALADKTAPALARKNFKEAKKLIPAS